MKLAFAIPTYNRSNSIHRRLLEISKISDCNVEVWISDNSTDDQTAVVASAKSDIPVKYQKNAFNIGGGANFLQSLLLGHSDYVWLRGDDDPITRSQFRSVIDVLSLNPDVIILSRNATKIEYVRTLREFFALFNLTQASGWLSMIIFKQSKIGFGLKWGYWGIRSGWANVCLVLGILRESPSPLFLVVPVSIASSDFREGGRQSRQWSVIETCVDNFPMTFEIIPTLADRKYALYQWRKTQGLALLRTYARSRLGLAPFEKLTFTTFVNLVSPQNPKSTLTAIGLLLLRILPRVVLTLLFVFFSFTVPRTRLSSLEIDDLLELGFFQRLAHLQRKQRISYPSSSFL